MLDDPALETLLRPYVDGQLDWPEAGESLFMQARDGWPLRVHPLDGLRCEQPFKPEADQLERSGFKLVDVDANVAIADGDSRGFATVWLLPPRQREYSRAELARAVTRTRPGGRVVVAARNDEGAKTLESDLRRLVGPVGTLSKNRCRVAWSQPLGEPVDPALLNQWLHGDAPRSVDGGQRSSRPGVFSWDRVDVGTALLIDHLPTGLSGAAADLGAGIGALAHALLLRNPGLSALDLYEADARALALARHNLADMTAPVPRFVWHDVAQGLEVRYDHIVTNPPFHALGRDDRQDLGQRFIEVAAQSLTPGGTLWLVANRHLAYESVLGQHFSCVTVLAQRSGFKIIKATNIPRQPSGKSARSKSAR